MKNIINSPVKKALLLAIIITGTGNLYAAEKEDNRNPLGCYDVGYEYVMDTLHLLPGKAGPSQSLYFLFNSLAEKVTLFQMRDEDSSHSMYLNHAINPGEWAVLSTTEKNMKYICTIPDGKSQYGKIVDCATSVRVCEYTNVKYGMNNRGNYWLVNSNNRNGAIREVVRYGIIPAI